jgi:hypothetical protein
MIFGFFASCEKDLMTYKGTERIGFNDDFHQLIKTFVYDNSSIKKDTIYLKVKTMGHIFKTDRTFKIEQIKDGKYEFKNDKYVKEKKIKTAKVAQHFVDFSNTDFVLKANKTEAKVPIILFRDFSLQTNAYGLKVRIVKNKFFELPETILSECLIIISDMLERPKNWDFFGTYGKVKHWFMIDVCDRKIDEDFFKLFIWGTDTDSDGNVINVLDYEKADYYRTLFTKALKKYNEDHPDNPLREEKEEGNLKGKLVEFLKK